MLQINTSATIQSYKFFPPLIGTFKIYYLGNFQLCTIILLTIIAMLPVTSP